MHSPSKAAVFALLLAGSSALLSLGSAFVTPIAAGSTGVAASLRGATAVDYSTDAHIEGSAGSSVLTSALGACSLAAAASFCSKKRSSKTAARYTTQVILPQFTWLKTGVKTADLKPRQLIARTVGGNDVLVGKDASGSLFVCANLCPHIGTPMSEGAEVIGDIIVCPLHGSSFNTKSGDLIDWCPSPPIIGPLTGFVVPKKSLLIFESRSSFFGGDVEVLVDINAKKAYEADYWKGLLDAQGKADGTYY